MIRSAIKNDFPILKRRIHGKRLVYLDSAATSQKPLSVIKTMDEFQRKYNANTHRGIYTLSEEATELYEGVRKKLATFINAWSEHEIVFTRNATESINLVAYSWGRANVQKGDNITVSEMEHHSNLVPWQLLAREKNAEIRILNVDDEGRVDLKQLERLITWRTKLVAITGMSNVLGTVPPIARIVKMAHKKGALVLVDAAQAAAHMPFDVRKWNADFVALSGHKMLGPSGVGALWTRMDLLQSMPPFLGGGDMIREVTLQSATWNDVPWKFEAGTPNAVGVVGWGAALEYLSKIGMGAVHQHERTLTAYALQRLQQVKGITIYGPKSALKKSGIVAFNVAGVHPHDLATLLDREGVAIRSGHHCAQPLLRNVFDVMATARMSFSVYTTKQDIDQCITAIEKAKGTFDV